MVRNVILASAVVVLLWAGIGFAENELITIQYVDLGETLKAAGILDKMVEDFEATYPNIKVEVLEWTYREAHEKYLTRIQAGNPPHCGYGYLHEVGTFKAMGAIVPFEDYADPDFLDVFFEANLAPVTIDGKVWAMPLWFSLRMLVYNKDWLTEAGFTEKDLDTTDSFMQVIKAIYNPPTRYGLAIAGARFKNTVENFLEFFWPMGGELLKYDESGKVVGVAFNDDRGVKALEYYAELGRMAQPGVLSHLQADAWRAFWSGLAFGTIDQPKVVGYILENNLPINWGVALPPRGTRRAVLAVEDVGLLFKTDEAHQRAAAKWLQWIKKPEYSFVVDKDKNFIPCVKEVAANPYYAEGGEGEWLGYFLKGAPYARFRPTIPEWAQIEDALITAIQAAISGRLTAKEALDQAAAKVNPLFENRGG